MAFTAFQPQGTTKLVAASSSTASTPTQVSTGNHQGMQVVNASTAALNVWIATAHTSDVQAQIPTTATPATGMFLPPNEPLNLTTPPGGWLSAITTAGTASVFATPGFYG